MKRFKDLSIKTKFAALFVLSGILIAVCALTFVYYSVMAGLGKVEDQWLEKAFLGLEAEINYRLDALYSIVKDYAYWDDMYNYVDTADKDWVKVNITDWIPKNFKIDLVLVFHDPRELIYRYGDFAEFQIGQDCSNHPLLKQAFASKETKGLYLFSKGIAFIASSQIMHTDESGPRNGTYLYARLIDKEILEEIKTLTGIDLSLISMSGVIDSTISQALLRPKNFSDIYNGLANKKFLKFNTYKPGYQYTFTYAILKDIQGKDIGMLELIRPRASILMFRNFFLKISLGVLIAVILLVLAVVLVSANIIFRPLDTLAKTIEEIQKTRDMLKRVKVNSMDEIGILAKDFNTMMDTLSNAQNELIKTQQNLIKAEKMSTAAELAIGTVHQINNPLSIVLGRLQLLRRLIDYETPIPEADLEKDLRIIEEQTQRAVDITSSLLRYATPIMLRFERCNINELLGDLIDVLKEPFQAKNISIVKTLKPDLPLVLYCDAGQMRDVFMNIITNAQQAMSGAGRLEVSTDYDEKKDLVCIKFTDNGYGIPPENIGKLFIPFFSTAAERSGLGLAISYNIVQGHSGTIEVESKVGKGTTFTVKLPVGGGLKDIV